MLLIKITGSLILLGLRYLLSVCIQWLQVLCVAIVVTGLCDFMKSVIDKIQHGSEVPNYQIISPIVLLLSAVSVCVYCVLHCLMTIDTDDNSDTK